MIEAEDKKMSVFAAALIAVAGAYLVGMTSQPMPTFIGNLVTVAVGGMMFLIGITQVAIKTNPKREENKKKEETKE